MKSIFLKSKSWIVVAIVVGIFVASIMYINSKKQAETSAVVVTVAKVSMRGLSDTILFTGILKPVVEIDIAAKTSGRITAMNVDIGARVTGDTLLAELDGSTDKATVNSLEENLTAIKQTTSAIDDLYAERIKSAEENLSLVKQVDSSNGSSTQNTKAFSAITGTAILASQVNDGLGELLSMRNSIRKYKDTKYYNNLGATNVMAKQKAEESLSNYQREYGAYQTFFNENILNKKPTNEVIEKGLILSQDVLVNAKVALSDSYTMLLYTIVTDTLTEAELVSYKTSVTNFGSQVEAQIQNIRGIQSEIVQTGLTLSALKKEKDSKLSEVNVQATQLHGQIAINETLIENSSIRAPFEGVITTKMVDVGSVIMPGTALYHLVSDDTLKVTVGIPDTLSDLFKVGDEGFIFVGDEEESTLRATITKIYPVVDPTSKKVTVELILDNKDHLLKAGSFVRVGLSQKTSDTSVTIPIQSVVSRYGLHYVFVLKDGLVTRKIVKTGVMTDTQVEILYGLSVGDTVVNEGSYYLRDGDKVEVHP